MALIGAKLRLTMLHMKRRFSSNCGRLFAPGRRVWDRIKLTVKSLCYNEHLSSGYVADTAMEPMFWFVDHFTESLGPVSDNLNSP